MFKVKKDSKGANVPCTIRFTEEIYQQLKQVSKENKVSFNSLILQCCKYALDNTEENNTQKNSE